MADMIIGNVEVPKRNTLIVIKAKNFPFYVGFRIIKYFIHEGFLLSDVHKILYYARLSNMRKMANSEKGDLYYFIVIM